MIREKWLNETEHVDHAKEVFLEWYKIAKPHLSEQDQMMCETAMKEAKTFKDTMYFVDLVAGAYEQAIRAKA